MNKLSKSFSILSTNLKSYYYVLTLCLNGHKGQTNRVTTKKTTLFASTKLVLHYFTGVWTCTFQTTLYVSLTQLLIANMISQIQTKENIHTFGISCIIMYNVSGKLTHFRMCGKWYWCPAAVLQLRLIPTRRKCYELFHSWLRRLYQPRRENDQVISWLASSEIIHIKIHFLLLAL